MKPGRLVEGRYRESGFSLIEALVALTVLALNALALLGATEAHVARVDRLEARALAEIAGQNHLAAMDLGLVADRAETELLQRPFQIRAERRATDDPDLQRVDIGVWSPGSPAPLARLTGFVDRAPRP